MDKLQSKEEIADILIGGAMYTLVEDVVMRISPEGALTSLTAAELSTIDEEYQAKALEYSANQYQRSRADIYPSLEEQADMAYWDRKNGTTTLDDAIDAVKLQYPKG